MERSERRFSFFPPPFFFFFCRLHVDAHAVTCVVFVLNSVTSGSHRFERAAASGASLLCSFCQEEPSQALRHQAQRV